MKFNKVYLQRDAIARHEDFDTWYEDGDLFYRFENKKGWTAEKQNISVIGRMGGENAAIRPDNRCLNYYLRFERYEYILHPYVINKHYYIEGMLWDLYGSFSNPPFDFVTETRTSYNKKDVHVKTRLFRDKGECFEMHVPDRRSSGLRSSPLWPSASKRNGRAFPKERTCAATPGSSA